MSQEQNTASIDLVRWTFSINPANRAAVEGHLSDLGLDVLVSGDENFVVTWEEPDRPVEEVIEEIWDLNEAPFEVTQEDFHRLSLHMYHHDDAEPAQDAA